MFSTLRTHSYSTFLVIINSPIESFHFSSNNELSFELLNNAKQQPSNNTSSNQNNLVSTASTFFQPEELKSGVFDDNMFDSMQGGSVNFDDGYLHDKEDSDEFDVKDIWKKLKNLEHNAAEGKDVDTYKGIINQFDSDCSDAVVELTKYLEEAK
ncbi:MAG: hypothetical protein WCF78_04700 [archaeon]